MTGARLPYRNVVPNQTLRNLIRSFQKEHPATLHALCILPTSASDEGARPQELNLAIFGTLSAEFPNGAVRSCEGFRIAVKAGVWWIASTNCRRTSAQQLDCETCGLAFRHGDRDHPLHVEQLLAL